MNAKQRRKQARANKALHYLLNNKAGEEPITGAMLDASIRRLFSRGYRLNWLEDEQGRLVISGRALSTPAETVTTQGEPPPA